MAASSKSVTQTSNITAVFGTDDLKVKETALRLSKELSPPDAGDFSNDIIQGTAENAEHCAQIVKQVIDALQTLPFFGGGKLVWLKNANFLGDNQIGKSHAATSGFESILDCAENLPSDIRLLISANAVDKRRTSYKRLQKIADLRVLDKPDTSKTGWEDEVIPQIERRARELGVSFTTEAVEVLVQLAGEDTRQLESEIEKLSLFVGDRKISVEDVRDLVPLNRAGVVFELGNALGKRDLRRALELVRTLLFQGQNPIGILLAAVVPRVRNLFFAADLLQQHPKLPRGNYSAFCGFLEKLAPSQTAHLPRKKDGQGFNAYPLFLALGESQRFSKDELRSALEQCLEANLKLVSTGQDPQLVLERLLMGILTPGKSRDVQAASVVRRTW